MIRSPDDAALAALCRQLRELGPTLDAEDAWPGAQLDLCAQHGVFSWFVSKDQGGQGWSDADITRGCLALSEACLTTSFVLTQLTGACRRIETTDNVALRTSLLPDLISGRRIATLGVSHLTTSRRHLGKPALEATRTENGFVLNGYSAWVTGAPHADRVVLGADLADGGQILVAVPTDRPGVERPTAASLVALTASQTGPVQCNDVEVSAADLVAGPVENVLQVGSGGGAGGLQTSTLAVGLSQAALTFAAQEATARPDLLAPVTALQEETASLRAHLLTAAEGTSAGNAPDVNALRIRANSLVLRSTQMGLVAAKGMGYVSSHDAGRWCREALFFLVWSCPPPVLAENLRQLAGLAA